MALLAILALVAQVVRTIVLVAVVLIAIVCVLDWVVRSRHLSPFHPLSRFMRRTVDPLLVPIERQVVRGGGLPTAAPLWALAGAVIAGILIVWGVDFVLRTVASLVVATASGPAGLLLLLVEATFSILRLAILVVVLVSWLPVSPYSPWVRWAFLVSEPILRPLRQIVPRLGPVDITPIVAYVLLGLLESALLRL